MHDTPEKESKHITDRDRFMTITKFAWDEKVEQIKRQQQKNDQLIEGLKSIENKLAYLPYDHDSKLIVMDMIDKLFDSIHVKGDRP